jgi:hypothetical protein
MADLAAAGRARPRRSRGPIQTGLVATATLGALLLLGAEFSPLFTIHVNSAAHPRAHSISAGSHDSYALVPVAVLALAMAFGIWRAGSRVALLAVGALGALALLLGLLRDLPDARAHGLLQSRPGHYLEAAARPNAGLYLETAGAALLILTTVSGFILIGPPPRRTSSRSTAANRPAPTD